MHKRPGIIILSEHPPLRTLLKAKLIEEGYRVSAPRDPARAALDRTASAVIVDLGGTLPADSPLLGAALTLPAKAVLMLLADHPLPSSRAGTFDSRRVQVVTQPFDLDALSTQVSALIARQAPPSRTTRR